MYNKTLTLLTPFIAVLATGCIDVTSHLYIQKDGSGTLTETVLMEKAAAETISSMMAGFSQQEEGKEPTPKTGTWWSESDLKNRASQIGEGVEFQKAEPLNTEKGTGYKATYTFKDVNKIKLTRDPNDRAPQNPNEENAEQPLSEQTDNKVKEEDQIIFKFTPGDTPRLSILMPVIPEAPETSPSENPPGDNTQLPNENNPLQDSANQLAENMMGAMGGAMGQMFKGMRAKTILTFEGNIVNTNAQHKQDNQITLMEVDFDKVFADPAALKSLSNAQGQSFGSTLSVLKNKADMKYDEQPEIFVEFK